jgi:NTE family protein
VVHLGADRIVAIAVRHERRPGGDPARPAGPDASPPLPEVTGHLLNAILLEALELDVDRMERINHIVSLVSPARRKEQPFREIPLLVLRPSQDLGELAADVQVHLPSLLRHLLRGIGAGRFGKDLLSYLAFEPMYVRQVIRLGYRDTMARRLEIEAFLRPHPVREELGAIAWS